MYSAQVSAAPQKKIKIKKGRETGHTCARFRRGAASCWSFFCGAAFSLTEILKSQSYYHITYNLAKALNFSISGTRPPQTSAVAKFYGLIRIGH